VTDPPPTTDGDYRTGTVGIIGRPSVGKSSLINAICGGQVAIVSPVPQTTRSRVRGVHTSATGQLVLLDTPGLHASTRKMNLVLRDRAVGVVADVEILLAVYDVSRHFGAEDATVSAVASTFSGPLVTALNKCDLAGPGDVQRWLESAELPAAPDVLPPLQLSAAAGTGVAALIDQLLLLSPVGPALYPDDMYTDQTPQFRCSEIIREQAFLRCRQEVPHALYVEVVDLENREDAGGAPSLWVRATIWVERESQVGIVVGHQGEGIGAIRSNAVANLGEVFGRQVRLALRVKVKKNWRQRDAVLQAISEPSG
jgi:GTP-binding protein Era